MTILHPAPDLERHLPVGRSSAATDPARARALLETWVRVDRVLRNLDDDDLTLEHDPADLGLAVVAGFAPEPDDWIAPEARTALPVALARGVPPKTVLHQIFATALDPNAGHAAPGGLADAERRLLAPGAAPAAHLPQAVGVAWAMRLRRASAIALATFGAEAASEPDLHNALNFAAVYDAPAVLLARSSPARARADGNPSLAAKALTYGVAAERVAIDAPLALLAAVTAALERARGGGGPALIEVVDDRSPSTSALAALAEAAQVSVEERRSWERAADAAVAEARAEIERAGPPARKALGAHVSAGRPDPTSGVG